MSTKHPVPPSIPLHEISQRLWETIKTGEGCSKCSSLMWPQHSSSGRRKFPTFRLTPPQCNGQPALANKSSTPAA
eukprot:2935232-Amphidinium_carterae.1